MQTTQQFDDAFALAYNRVKQNIYELEQDLDNEQVAQDPELQDELQLALSASNSMLQRMEQTKIAYQQYVQGDANELSEEDAQILQMMGIEPWQQHYSDDEQQVSTIPESIIADQEEQQQSATVQPQAVAATMVTAPPAPIISPPAPDIESEQVANLRLELEKYKIQFAKLSQNEQTWKKLLEEMKNEASLLQSQFYDSFTVERNRLMTEVTRAANDVERMKKQLQDKDATIAQVKQQNAARDSELQSMRQKYEEQVYIYSNLTNLQPDSNCKSASKEQ